MSTNSLYDAKPLSTLRLYLNDMGIYARISLITNFIKVVLSAEILLLLLTGLTNDYIYALASIILPLPLTLYALAITLFTLPYMRRVRIETVADVIRSESIVLVRDPATQLLSIANMVIAYTILSTLVFVAPAIASTPQPHMFIALATIYASTYVTYKLGTKLLQKKFAEIDVPT